MKFNAPSKNFYKKSIDDFSDNKYNNLDVEKITSETKSFLFDIFKKMNFNLTVKCDIDKNAFNIKIEEFDAKFIIENLTRLWNLWKIL